MNEKLKPFVVLQQLDTRRAALRRKLEDALRRKDGLKGDLKAAQAGKEKADEAKRIREKHLMDAQLRLKSAEERRKGAEERSLKIANQREYAAMQEQIATAKSEISALEDEVLGLMDAVEGVRRDADFAAKALREQEERQKRIDADLAASTGEAMEELTRIEAEIAESEKACAPDILLDYKRLVKRTNSIAVAAAIGGVCQACFTKLPPQVENLIAGDAVVTCRSCQVYLYKG